MLALETQHRALLVKVWGALRFTGTLRWARLARFLDRFTRPNAKGEDSPCQQSLIRVAFLPPHFFASIKSV